MRNEDLSVRVYLDHNATTPTRPEVVDAMARSLRDGWGNPSSVHAEGAHAREAVEHARAQVAALLACTPADLVFTGGATEANNTALLGVLADEPPGHVVSSRVEHPSVEASLVELERAGWSVSRVAVDDEGVARAEAVLDAIRDETRLVSLIWANNETGALQPVEDVAAAARERGLLVHTDATQRVGKLPIDLGNVPAQLLSLSAHKLGGPKGVGALVCRDGVGFTPRACGGPQEGRRRGGTENVAGIVGLGVACERAQAELAESAAHCAALRDRLWDGIREKVPRVRRNGPTEEVLPNTLNVEFVDTAGELLLQALDLAGVAASAGAACASGSIDPSPVLVAMGRTPQEARGALRFSVGEGVDAAQIDYVLGLLPDLVERARAAGDV